MLENRRDPEATKAAGFYHKNSYVTFAGHTHLWGEVDHGIMRRRIYDRAKGMCQTCPTPHFVDWDRGHWSHTGKSFGGKRCDGLCCGEWSCHDGHKKYRHNGRDF